VLDAPSAGAAGHVGLVLAGGGVDVGPGPRGEVVLAAGESAEHVAARTMALAPKGRGSSM